MTEERIRLSQSQLTLDVQQNRLEQWEILLLQEKRKDKPDKTVLAAAALKVIQAYSNISAWSVARVEDDQKKVETILSSKSELQTTAEAMYTRGDADALLQLVDSAVSLENRLRLGDQATDSFIERFAQVSKREWLLNIMFFLSYVAGSVLIGWEWAKSKMKEPTTLR